MNSQHSLYKFGQRNVWLGCVAALLGGILASGCVGEPEEAETSLTSGPNPIAVSGAQMFPLDPPKEIAPGIMMSVGHLDKRSDADQVWIYLPKNKMGQGKKAKLPCVVINAAGSRLFHGMDLGEGDRPEHLPYVKAGYAVVAYETAGTLKDDGNDEELIEAATEFKDSNAGVENALDAIAYATTRVPEIDKDNIISAGHSSAATLSLQVAQNEPRIKACIAYAPACNTEKWLGKQALDALDKAIPGYTEFIKKTSPLNNTASLKCPTFIFRADDDTNIKMEDTEAFVTKLKQTNKQVTYAKVKSGGHYDSMIEQGVPQAIKWLKTLKLDPPTG